MLPITPSWKACGFGRPGSAPNWCDDARAGAPMRCIHTHCDGALWQPSLACFLLNFRAHFWGCGSQEWRQTTTPASLPGDSLMAKTVADVMNMVKESEVKFIDFRFTDTRGKEQHVSVPVSAFDEDKFTSGHAFDGSSIAGWKGIEASDMLLMPDPNTANLDPFFEEPTLLLSCDVLDPTDGKAYERDPRSLAKRAEAYMKASGLGDAAYFGPEPEFFIFDSVRWQVDMSGSFCKIESEDAAWNTGKDYEHGNSGYRPAVKGGYFPTPPIDSMQDMRSEMCLILESLGIPVEVHHHEVAQAQMEIGTRFSTLVERADWLQLQKYVIQNVAHSYGKTATFMPKPIVGDNGSGMHVHQSVWKGGKNLFAGDGYAGLSEFALFYIGGIIKHARALNAITNPGTNSYKRLVPGFEAPVKLAYSSRNRSASVRIPYVANDKARRIEARFPDPIANPYLASVSYTHLTLPTKRIV